MMAQMSSDFYGVEIMLKTTQPKNVYNIPTARIFTEFLAEDDICQKVFILLWGMRSSRKYR